MAFALVSPFVGQMLGRFGRKNFLILGCFIMFLSNFGFAMMHFIDNTNAFVFTFILTRIVQGVGTGIIQTANYSIASVVYRDSVEFAIGSLEACAGFGLCIGPLIGIVVFNYTGYFGSFATFTI